MRAVHIPISRAAKAFRQAFSVFLALCLAAALCTTAFAAVDTSRKVYDEAGLLADSEAAQLREDIAALMSRHAVDIVVLTADSSGGLSSEDYGNRFYDENGFGVGEHGDGVMLFINMGDREVFFGTTGRCKPLFEAHVDAVLDDVYDYLSAGDFAGAAGAFLADTGRILEQAGFLPDLPAPPPYEPVPNPGASAPGSSPEARPAASEAFGASLAAGAAISAVVLVIMLALHSRSLPKPAEYRTYLASGVRIRRAEDTFIGTFTTRTAIPRDTSSSGGRSGGGGGRSHGGGTRKF